MTLPLLLSIPHGGTDVPGEVRDRTCIADRDLFDDSDAYTREIFDLGDAVAHVVAFDIARAFVDVNRADDDRPPENPDGVVKSTTCFGRPIYHRPVHEDDALVDALLNRYHRPFHRRLTDAAADPCVRLALDCHSMLATPPPIAPDRVRPRPLFCLGDRHGATAPSETTAGLAEALGRAFDCGPDEVRLNDPFAGGYITRTHATGAVPWIQVEMNRSWYLSDPWFDPDSLTVDPDRLADLRRRFRDALEGMTWT